jgi:hypothetical protein
MEVEHLMTHRGDTPFHQEWACSCGYETPNESEALEHTRNVDSPSVKILNCIARNVHQPQPVEIIYEMRAQKTAAGSIISSPVEGSKWMRCPQGAAERSRVTEFACANCGHHDKVAW